ncbi:MAG: YitT family protein [Agathobaculum desmolans]|uniref:YitT family protein n=1 Tax=Agathobaculum desmolans TaxID=39484 RepID=UPI0039957EB2
MQRRGRYGLAGDLACDVLGGILYAAALQTFARGAAFAPGGVSGLALLLHHLFGLPIGLTAAALNLPLFALSYRLIGRRFLLRTARSMVSCTFFLDVVFARLPAYTGDPFLAALYAGVLLGLALAVLYARGSSSGGIDLIVLSVKAVRPHVSTGTVMLAVDAVVILLGWPVFGQVDAVLYGLAATAVTSLTLDRILYGMGAGRLIFIITGQGVRAAAGIAAACGRGATIVQATGAFTGKPRMVLLCACARSEAYRVRAAVYAEDPAAFVMITETSEVFGEGFSVPP